MLKLVRFSDVSGYLLCVYDEKVALGETKLRVPLKVVFFSSSGFFDLGLEKNLDL